MLKNGSYLICRFSSSVCDVCVSGVCVCLSLLIAFQHDCLPSVFIQFVLGAEAELTGIFNAFGDSIGRTVFSHQKSHVWNC